MNLEKIDILKFLKGKLRSSVSLSEKRITNAHRDWMIGLGVGTIIFLCAATYFGYHFYTHLTETSTNNTEEIFPVEYKRTEVESILSTYHERKTTFEELRRIRNVAPSIPVTPSEETGDPLAEDEDGQYSSGTTTEPVVE